MTRRLLYLGECTDRSCTYPDNDVLAYRRSTPGTSCGRKMYQPITQPVSIRIHMDYHGFKFASIYMVTIY